ncbi:MAG: hypothetical protein GF401_14965 [Chitinivibrionales bacterium]|nr:hypothetical protein [Chitinivibrionales bacterium]
MCIIYLSKQGQFTRERCGAHNHLNKGGPVRRMILLVVFALATTGMAGDYLEDVSVIRAILDSNGITGVSIESITKSKDGRITHLDLSSKDLAESFVDRIPPVIGKLSELQSLNLAHNTLMSIPAEIGNLTKLKNLDLRGNDLSRLPESFANLTELEKLDLGNNSLYEFPGQVVGMEKLWYLHLQNNKIKSLPEDISSMTGLKELYLKGNRLETLPLSIMNMSLAYCELIENELCDLPPDLDEWMKKKDKQYKDWQRCF